MSRDPEARLVACLLKERRALLSADFATLARLERTKAEICGVIERAVSETTRNIAERNNVLLAAAADGIGQARAHIEGHSATNAGFATYDREGRRAGPEAPQNVVRRA